MANKRLLKKGYVAFKLGRLTYYLEPKPGLKKRLEKLGFSELEEGGLKYYDSLNPVHAEDDFFWWAESMRKCGVEFGVMSMHSRYLAYFEDCELSESRSLIKALAGAYAIWVSSGRPIRGAILSTQLDLR